MNQDIQYLEILSVAYEELCEEDEAEVDELEPDWEPPQEQSTDVNLIQFDGSSSATPSAETGGNETA